MISILDYGMGNIQSVYNAFLYNNIKAKVITEAKELNLADKLVFPGVSSFPDCIKELNRKNLTEALIQFINSGKPYLGICLGMHILYEISYEIMITNGLSIIPGKIERFSQKNINNKIKIPHIGWNNIKLVKENNLFKDIPDSTYFYFDHSFASFDIDHFNIATCDYGVSFSAAISKDNVYGLQFHPEKSAKYGLRIIKNFANL
ncbi:MAG: imidazole glycerol phosphate synthase subunit HisH [Deferribacterota bacterium]|nr:imidazole glycerol phosphate synthase subunit HisH [Deferribacterota bacterium]